MYKPSPLEYQTIRQQFFDACSTASVEARHDILRISAIPWFNYKTETFFFGANGIYLAARAKNFYILKLLYQLGLNPDTPDNLNQSPLHIAIDNTEYFEPFPIVEFLLNTLQVKVNRITTGKQQYTPLHCAIKRDQHLIVRALLKAGASPKLTCNQALTPAQLAKQYGAHKCLLELSVTPFARSYN